MRRQISSFWLSFLWIALSAAPGVAQNETIYMAVLASIGPRYDADGEPRAGLFVSKDRGVTWELKGWRDYIRTFYAEEGSDGLIWSACGNGVLRSADGGKSWRVTTGWEVTEVLKVKAAEANPAVVFAATAYGIFRSTDGGENWERKSGGMRPPYSGDICIDRTDWRHLLAATEQGLYKSRDGGDHWSLAGLKGKGVRVVVQDPHDARRFWLGTEENGVFCSRDGGTSWEGRSEGLGDMTVYPIAVHPENENRIYAGTFAGGVFMSTNGGATWEGRSRGLTDPQVHSLVLLPSDPDILFAGTLNDGLFRSTNGGETWHYMTQKNSQVWGLSVRNRNQKP
jgi:photosystem II stability/assembly factor-like uncharacterized protein